MAGTRGTNPIWAEFDLQGNLFDDTFYMWVLENTLPYIPATVYHDPGLNSPWTNPVQFLSNGTLPVNIFFEPGKLYRLEFRQNNGINPPSQADPLIYEVNDYSPGAGGGSGPINSVAFASSNQITNPQFALLGRELPFTLTGASTQSIYIAPNWYLDVTGTGNITIDRVSFNNSTPTTSNAPYALRINASGWDPSGVVLRQRFEENGMLWANKYVSTAITARIQGAPQNINAILEDSNGSTLAEILATQPVSSAFEEYTGFGQLAASTNPDLPPVAYIEYKLNLPSNVDIYVTSISVVVQDLPFTTSFEQDSINRQIDHTYNFAYPIVPIGTVIDYVGYGPLRHYLDCNGAPISRQDYDLLFNTVTTVETVTLASTVNTFTVSAALAPYLSIGMAIEGNGIPAATGISNISGTTVTISNAATITGASDVRFFFVGSGDGATTFNLPNLINHVTAGFGGNLFAAGTNGLAAQGGNATHTLIASELPPHTHDYTPTTVQAGVPGFGFASGTALATPTLQTGPGPGASQAFSLVQPTALLRKMIRYE